jgi:hypothetical protein
MSILLWAMHNIGLSHKRFQRVFGLFLKPHMAQFSSPSHQSLQSPSASANISGCTFLFRELRALEIVGETLIPRVLAARGQATEASFGLF